MNHRGRKFYEREGLRPGKLSHRAWGGYVIRYDWPPTLPELQRG
jgi:hypothetical protein